MSLQWNGHQDKRPRLHLCAVEWMFVAIYGAMLLTAIYLAL